jgi:leucyl aminopeptidase
MEIITRVATSSSVKSACVVVGVYEKGGLSSAAQSIDSASKGAVSRVFKRGDIDGKVGKVAMLYDVAGVASERVLLVGLGAQGKAKTKDMRAAMAAAMKALESCGAKEAVAFVLDEGVDYAVQQLVIAANDVAFRTDACKGKNNKSEEHPIAKLTLASESAANVKQATAALPTAKALASGMAFTKRLGNLPGNVATPSYLASEAMKLKKMGIAVKVLEKKDCEKLGMNTFLSVSQGSAQPPKFIIMEYKGGPKGGKPTVLVGKGITFDTGGISLKPGPEMDHMKWDMSGAGSVLGVFRALGELKPKCNVIGLIPTCENMPGGRAVKPGDIVTSMSGQTIENLNTDAEGRLILCDALTYAERFNPRVVIDVATLTGACVIALGSVVSGLYATTDKLANDLLEAGQRTHDRTWRMPLWDDYQDALNSNFADMANIGGREGGSITAACFLWRFAKKYDWAHLDIAGIAYKGSGKEKGATGRPVPMLLDYVLKNA